MRHSLIAIVILSIGSIPSAHPAPWEMSRRLDKVLTSYKVDKVETVFGVVEKIYDKVPSNFPNRYTLGFHCTLVTEKEKLDIHLGPIWYIQSLNGKVDVGDRVQVVGSGSRGHPGKDGKAGMREILAAEVRKDGAVVLKLRDKDGRPLWSGQ